MPDEDIDQPEGAEVPTPEGADPDGPLPKGRGRYAIGGKSQNKDLRASGPGSAGP